jgi:hypothetical protein
MTGKYGKPDEVTPTMLVWYNNGPWEKSVIYKKEYMHEFPMPHTDVLQQWVSLEIPEDKFDDLAMYDGSVVVERTTGMVSARCDKEAANFLALNLAHEVAEKGKTVDEARSFYGKTIMELMKGEKPEYTQKLKFNEDKHAADKDKALNK